MSQGTLRTCGAWRADGSRCRLPAGWGSGRPGRWAAGRCVYHGGASYSGRVAAASERAWRLFVTGAYPCPVPVERLRGPARLRQTLIMETAPRSRPHGVHPPREVTFRLALGPELGGELRETRRRAGLGLRPAARRVGIGHGYLALLEAGLRAPSRRVAHGLVEALNLPPEPTRRLYDLAEQVEEGRERREAERQGWADGTPDPCAPPAMLARGRAARGQAVSGR